MSNTEDEYTPATDEVRREWAQLRADGYALVTDNADSIAEAEFDRWLEAHDREVAAKALTDAAEEFARAATAGVEPVLNRLAANILAARAAKVGAVSTGQLSVTDHLSIESK